MRVLSSKWFAALGAAFAVVGAARNASAFCGFYVAGSDRTMFNDATQVVMMREGTRTVLAMQNAYEGPPENFALVIPVPIVLQKENVKTLAKEVFSKVDQMSSPRLVEYWEQDPCPRALPQDMAAPSPMAKSESKSGAGPGSMATAALVKVEARFEVGEYEIVILSAEDSGALETWLRQEKYSIPPGAEPYLRPYVADGSKFFVAKVDPQKLAFKDGKAVLSPLRFHYDTDKFNLPVRLGLLNSKGQQDLIVHVFSPNQRYEAANYPNVTIPTNLELSEKAKEDFVPFYTSLFAKTVEENPKAVVTEYSWSAASCDPCPGPTMTQGELASLGADVLPSARWGHPGQQFGDPVQVEIGSPQVKGGVPNAERVVAGMRPRIRACYAMARQRTPELGSFEADVKIDVEKTGTVKGAAFTMKGADGKPVTDAALSACVTQAVQRTMFDKSESASAQVSAHLKFVAPPPPDPSQPKVLLSVPYNLVHTRLHARYTKESLGQDLVFRQVEGIAGGREVMLDGKLENGSHAMPGGQSTFQGRYIIRHKWEGAATCSNPRFGVWGGPPGDPYGHRAQNPNVAANLAFAPPSKKVVAASYVLDPSSVRYASANRGPNSDPNGREPKREPRELEGAERFGAIWPAFLGVLFVAMFFAGREGKRKLV